MIRAYERYQDGYLPANGGMAEQAQCFVEALPWIVRLWSFHEALQRNPKLRFEVSED